MYRLKELFNQMTSKQRDEQLEIMNKEIENFYWSRLDRSINSISFNSEYKLFNELWIDFIKRIKRRTGLND